MTIIDFCSFFFAVICILAVSVFLADAWLNYLEQKDEYGKADFIISAIFGGPIVWVVVISDLIRTFISDWKWNRKQRQIRKKLNK